MVYYFDVAEGYLRCTNSKKIIISDSVNYHTAHFTFDTTWDGLNKSAIFTNTKTNESVMVILDADDNCIIPFEPLEVSGDNNYLDVCVKGNLDTTTRYTYMDVKIVIFESGKTDASTPAQPTQDVYDQILQIASDKYVDALVGSRTILPTDWQTATEIFPITSVVTPIVITNLTTTLSTGTFTDYLNRTNYPYSDFYIDYSIDGINMTRISANGERGNSPNLRKIQFTIGSNTYEVRVTSSSITISRTSGTTAYYIHNILLRFDDYFYYDYTISGFTTKHQAWLYLEDSSKEFIKDISFKRYPITNNGYIRLNFSQRPDGNLNILHRALKTGKDLPYAIWMNTEGDVVYKNIIPEPISDLTTMYDEYVCTVGQIKEYINSKLGGV